MIIAGIIERSTAIVPGIRPRAIAVPPAGYGPMWVWSVVGEG
jgi:hypothetical protein